MLYGGPCKLKKIAILFLKYKPKWGPCDVWLMLITYTTCSLKANNFDEDSHTWHDEDAVLKIFFYLLKYGSNFPSLFLSLSLNYPLYFKSFIFCVNLFVSNPWSWITYMYPMFPRLFTLDFHLYGHTYFLTPACWMDGWSWHTNTLSHICSYVANATHCEW